MPNNLPVMQSFSPSVSLVWASPLCTVQFKLVPVFNLDMFGNLTHTHILFSLRALSLSSVGSIYPSPESYQHDFSFFHFLPFFSYHACCPFLSFTLWVIHFPSDILKLYSGWLKIHTWWELSLKMFRLYEVFICLSLLTHGILRWEFETPLSFKPWVVAITKHTRLYRNTNKILYVFTLWMGGKKFCNWLRLHRLISSSSLVHVTFFFYFCLFFVYFITCIPVFLFLVCTCIVI